MLAGLLETEAQAQLIIAMPQEKLQEKVWQEAEAEQLQTAITIQKISAMEKHDLIMSAGISPPQSGE